MNHLLYAMGGNRFVTEMLLSCLWLMFPHYKRKYFWLRVFSFGIMAEGLSFLLMNSTIAREVWQNSAYVVLNCCIHAIVFATLSVMYIWFCCPVSRKEAIYCATLCLCVQHFASSLYLVLEILIPIEGYLAGSLLWIGTMIIPSALFYFFFIRLICERGYYQISVLNLTSATCLIFLTSSFISTAAKALNELNGGPLFLISQIYEMLCCLFLLWMQVNQKKTLQLQHKLDIQDYLQHLRREQFQQSSSDMNLMIHLMHELKHQIANVTTEENIETKEELLDQISENLQIYDETFHTQNETLNMVLMERRLFCRANHVNWMVVADGEQLDFIKIDDLYLIFRNALDNAIENVVKLEDIQRRIIDVRVYSKNGFVMIQVENDFEGRLQFEDGLPLTTKGTEAYYGFGLKTIRQIAERYGGCLAINAEKQRFTFQVMIPISRI